MTYFKSRRNTMIKRILNLSFKHNDCYGVSVVFDKNIKKYVFYKFDINKVYKCSINSDSWSSEISYIDSLTWSELSKISNTISFVEKSKFNDWVASRKNSLFLKISNKIYSTIF